MELYQSTPHKAERGVDEESLLREIASLRTYLMVVAGNLTGTRPHPAQGVSDLVHSVLADVFEEIRAGNCKFTYKSDGGLRSWLAKRLRWTQEGRVRRCLRYARILSSLPPRPGTRTPSSDLDAKEQERRLAAAQANLDSDERQLIEWRVNLGLMYREIGQRKGCSTTYARQAWLKTLQKLRSIYMNTP
jgi:RNA polymerase sigma factor (sigma-70 family)